MKQIYKKEMKQQDISKKIKIICKKNHFQFCVIFGSSVKKNKYQRDIDIAFYCTDKDISSSYFEIYNQLQPLFEKPLDLIFLNSRSDPLLVYEISLHSQLLFEKNKGDFLEFQTKAWKQYLDTKKYRDYEKKYFKEKLKNVS